MRQEFTQELKNIYHSNMQDVHTTVPGKILTFDPDKCEAKIQPIAKYRLPDDSTLDFPDLFHVPVFFMQSHDQTATIVYPVKPGDACVIFFSEQALDQWRTGAESKTDLRFDLTNAYAIVGMPSQPNPHVRRAYDNESIIVQRESTFIELFDKRIEVHTNGNIAVEADVNINMEAGVDINITAKSNITITANANITITANANTIINTTGETNITSGGSCNIKAAAVNLN